MRTKPVKAPEMREKCMRLRLQAPPPAPPVAPSRTAVGIALLCTPVAALAHGTEILAMPVGNLVALVAVVVATLTLKVGRKARLAAILLALAVALLPYFVPNSYLPWELTSSEWGNVFIGVVPPLLAAALFLAWRRRAAARH